MRIERIIPSATSNLLGLLAGLAGLTLTPAFAQTDTITSPPSSTPVEMQASFSPGIREVLKMVDAKVDVEVIKAYIKNSSTAYNPTATEIIALKQHGVPDDVITALIQRGGEVRAQLAQAAVGPGAPPATAPYTPESGYGNDYGASMGYPASTYPAYADYAYGYPYGGYPYYPYYGYPYYGYYGYPYWWYSWYWPFYYPYYAFHDHHDHFHDGHSHDGHSVAVHGHNGNWSGHGAPWASASHSSVASHTGFAARTTMASSSMRTGSFTVRPTAFNGVRNMGFAARSAAFAPRSSGFAARSGGFAPRSGGMAMRGGGGFAMHGGGGFAGGHGGGGFGGGHGGGGHR